MVLMTCLFLLAPAGCRRRADWAIRPPDLDPDQIGQRAIEQYDANQDGAIAGDELQQALSLEFALAELDADGDQRVTAKEIADCVESWKSSGVGLTNVDCRVSLAGKPLVGATVRFEPESFHGSSISPAAGVSDDQGVVRLVAEDAKAQGLPDGMHLGFYRVRISKQSHGSELIPAKYNVATTLGRAISANDRMDVIEFGLSQ